MRHVPHARSFVLRRALVAAAVAVAGAVAVAAHGQRHLLLAARAEGLGCVLTTLLCMEEPAVKKLLDIPDDWHTAAHVPLGYPVLGGHGPIARKPISKMTSMDRFGR